MDDRLNAKMMESREVNVTIKKSMNPNNEDKIYVQNASGLDNIAVGLNRNVYIVIRNDVGDLIGALNDGATIRVEGSADRYAADGMTGGEVVIEGDVDEGAGTAQCGGTLVVKGRAKDHVGQLLKGGTIIVCGNVGDYAGSFMIAGTIIVGGDAGRELGASMLSGTIYIKGDYETMGENLRQTKLTNDDEKLLRDLFAKYQLGLGVDGFKKIVPQEKRLM